MTIENDMGYMDGQWAGRDMVNKIEKTMYGNIDEAIRVKQELIDQFEKDFGYTRDMEQFDRNYSFNMGVLDTLLENQA